MNNSVWREKCEKMEDIRGMNIVVSHIWLAFFYGIFLFLYEIKFMQELVAAIHPIFIIWSGVIIAYDILVRKAWREVPFWKILILFALSAGITTVLTLEAGLMGNIKTWILTILPLFAFYPTGLIKTQNNDIKNFLTMMSGAAIVSCAASAIAIGMYLEHFSETITWMGVTNKVGIQYYFPDDPSSAMILYGLYIDTNHAALYALIFIIYSLMLLKTYYKDESVNKWKRRGICSFAVLNMAVQIGYFPLANSRGGWVALAVSLGCVCFLFIFNRIAQRKGKVLKVVVSIVGSFAVVLISIGFLLVVRTGLSSISAKIETNKINTQNVNNINSNKNVQGTNNSAASQGAKKSPQSPQNTQSSKTKKDSFTKENEKLGAGRVAIWMDAVKLIRHKPIMGEGAGNNIYYASIYSPDGVIAQKGSAIHNSYLDLILDYGIIGAVLLLSFWGLCSKVILKYLFTERQQCSSNIYLCSAIVLIAASGICFISSAFINVTAIYFVMLSVTGYAMAECVMKRE